MLRTAFKRLLPCIAAILALAGCASAPPALTSAASYDFGVIDGVSGDAVPGPTVPIRLASVDAPPDLDTEQFRYRLLYSSPQQPRAYGASRWSMPPPQLLTARLRAHLSRSGPVLSAGEDPHVPLLKIELDEFAQLFDQPGVSRGAVRMHASLFKDGTLLAQREFNADAPSVSADAAGGARALAFASDAAIDQVMAWLATQPL